ncbi:unnamed protein product [Adineta steineri]|uniref:G-protein coupled receptors family 1 profile domain-containing protein n=1 Tax=Adineta steineri TaxID=433720 RepID=A0A815I7M0_9BILA|nr:unnamed protein product [Adineta steineri]CAF1361776.1 unnamed protein product [Adineta steineri]
MNSEENDTSTTTFQVAETQLTRLIKYIIFQTFQIPAIFCFILIFYSVYRERELRRLHNHVMLLILLSCFILLIGELPITLSFFYRGWLEPQSDRLCLYWIFMNYTFEAMIFLLMAFASIERFVLIFFSTVITGSGRRKCFFHYIPMIFCCVLVIFWYIILLFLYPCVNTFNFSSFLCNSACYQSNVVIGTIDWVGTVLLPVLITIVFNVLLLIRVILQKRRLHIGMNWRRSRKMLIQLLSVVLIFLCTQIPLTIFALIRLIFDPNFLSTIVILWYYFTTYFIILLIPFAYVITTNEIHKHLIILKFCKPRLINPVTVNTIQQPKYPTTKI